MKPGVGEKCMFAFYIGVRDFQRKKITPWPLSPLHLIPHGRAAHHMYLKRQSNHIYLRYASLLNSHDEVRPVGLELQNSKRNGMFSQTFLTMKEVLDYFDSQ